MKINFKNKYELFRVLLLIIMLNIIPKYNSQSDWCWTKSMANDPTYVFDPKKGGINWGYCDEVKSNPIETVNYDVQVNTSKLPKSGSE
jgi:hypothetical protein